MQTWHLIKTASGELMDYIWFNHLVFLFYSSLNKVFQVRSMGRWLWSHDLEKKCGMMKSWHILRNHTCISLDRLRKTTKNSSQFGGELVISIRSKSWAQNRDLFVLLRLKLQHLLLVSSMLCSFFLYRVGQNSLTNFTTKLTIINCQEKCEINFIWWIHT
jgi:hypothetical protein